MACSRLTACALQVVLPRRPEGGEQATSPGAQGFPPGPPGAGLDSPTAAKRGPGLYNVTRGDVGTQGPWFDFSRCADALSATFANPRSGLHGSDAGRIVHCPATRLMPCACRRTARRGEGHKGIRTPELSPLQVREGRRLQLSPNWDLVRRRAASAVIPPLQVPLRATPRRMPRVHDAYVMDALPSKDCPRRAGSAVCAQATRAREVPGQPPCDGYLHADYDTTAPALLERVRRASPALPTQPSPRQPFQL